MIKASGKFLLPIVVSLILTLVLVALIDIAFGLLTKDAFTTSVDSPVYDGFLLASDKTITQTFNFEDGVHTSHYTLAPGGYRFTPIEHPEDRDRFVVFMGCSHIFGTTVEDDETIPFYAAEYNKQIMPYNFGKPGGSLQHSWYHLKHRNIRDDIHEENGVFIYLYVDFHLRRIIGGLPSPAITIDSLCVKLEDNRLVEKGTFGENMPWRWRFYSFLRHTHLPWHFGLTFPLSSPDEKDWNLITSLFQETAKQANTFFPGSRFVILFLNAPLGKKEISQRLQKEHTTIEFINLNSLLESQGISIKNYPDGHFYPESNKALAQVILDALAI